MLKFVVIAVVVAIGIVLVIAAMRPDSLHVERSVNIHASATKILPFLTSLRSDGFSAWSPYEKKDPNMQRMYSGATRGQGAVYEWDGNSSIGKGRLEIAAVDPDKVVMNLDFIKPIAGHNVAEFKLQPTTDNNTRVTWTMDGASPFISKLMGMFFNMDTMIGTDFEAGLLELKALAEK